MLRSKRFRSRQSHPTPTLAAMSKRRRRRQKPILEEDRFHTVRIDSLVAGGRAMARLPDGRVVFVAYAAPGELVEIEVERLHADYLEAVTIKVIEPSGDRIEPRCELFGTCGGCQLQHMTYSSQLAAKEDIVREQLERIGRLDSSVVRPMVGARDPWGYRNHLRFSTGKMYGDIGFVHRRGRGLLKVEQCPVADPWANELLPAMQGKGAGLHQVQVRRDPSTGEFLIAPEVPGLEVESGQESYVQTLAGHEFQVSVASFFQVNHAQAERMLELIRAAMPERAALMVDAFCGRRNVRGGVRRPVRPRDRDRGSALGGRGR